jgi:large subunit ribosomal protein L25
MAFMQEIKLKTKKREVVGRKVNNLRKEGLIPANIYGKKIKSCALTVEDKEFEKVFKQVGETGIVKLLIEGESEEHPILIQNVQYSPLTDLPLHVDFRQLVLTEKITAKIPVELTGEPLVVAEKAGILIQITSEIEIQALPTDLPDKFVIDVSKLEKVGDEIKVKEIAEKQDKKIEIKTDLEQIVAKIDPLAKEEVAPVATAPAEGEVAAPTEGGEQPVAEAPASEGKEEKTEEKKKE